MHTYIPFVPTRPRVQYYHYDLSHMDSSRIHDRLCGASRHSQLQISQISFSCSISGMCVCMDVGMDVH